MFNDVICNINDLNLLYTNYEKYHNMTIEELKHINWKKIQNIRNIEAAILRTCFSNDKTKNDLLSVDILVNPPVTNIGFIKPLKAKDLNEKLKILRNFLKNYGIDKYFKVYSKHTTLNEISIKYEELNDTTLEDINNLVTLAKLCFDWKE